MIARRIGKRIRAIGHREIVASIIKKEKLRNYLEREKKDLLLDDEKRIIFIYILTSMIHRFLIKIQLLGNSFFLTMKLLRSELEANFD